MICVCKIVVIFIAIWMFLLKKFEAREAIDVECHI